MAKQIISFSLWGNNSKYCIGAIKNAKLALDYYPGWICRYYVGQEVPQEILNKLASFQNVELADMPPEYPSWFGMFARFAPASETDIDIFLSRDCDSRLNKREALAVEAWLQSDKIAHVMHTHFHHSVPMLGGMFGLKKGAVLNFDTLLSDWLAQPRINQWQCDQRFLAEIIWPIVKEKTLNHADFHTNIWPGVQFPTPIELGTFIGATYDENDQINKDQLRDLYG